MSIHGKISKGVALYIERYTSLLACLAFDDTVIPALVVADSFFFFSTLSTVLPVLFL